ncbi:MAG: hypothetical protein ACQEU4_04895 [Bacillota bacterium]
MKEQFLSILRFLIHYQKSYKILLILKELKLDLTMFSSNMSLH